MNQQETIIARINQINPEVLSEAGWSNPEGYLNRAYAFLNALPRNKTLKVEALAETENIELFTLVVCLYICEVKNNTVSFIRDDMKEFRKN